MRGEGGVARLQPKSTAVQMEPINFGDLTPLYLPYDAAGQKYKDDVNVYLLHAKSRRFQTE